MGKHINESKTQENPVKTNQESHITNLAMAQERLKQMRESGMRTERLDHYQKLALNPGSRKYAINAKCWDCSCEQIQEVKYCQVVSCPLFNHRPYKPHAKHN